MIEVGGELEGRLTRQWPRQERQKTVGGREAVKECFLFIDVSCSACPPSIEVESVRWAACCSAVRSVLCCAVLCCAL